MRAEALARKPASAGVRTTMGLIADQVIARATRPEHNRTRPATATARKLLEANSSRMVHHLSCAPLLRTERPSLCTVKAFSTPAGSFGAGWCFRATPIGASIGGTARLVRARRARHASMRTLIGRQIPTPGKRKINHVVKARNEPQPKVLNLYHRNFLVSIGDRECCMLPPLQEPRA